MLKNRDRPALSDVWITHGSPTWALNQTFSRSGKFNFGASTVTSSRQHPRRLAQERAFLLFSRLLHPTVSPLPLPLASHLLPLSWWRNAAMKFSPPTRRSTCRNVPVKYSRGFMAAFQSIIGVYPWKIKRHPSWPRTSACQSIDARRVSRSLSRFLFFIFSILVHTLSRLVLLFSTSWHFTLVSWSLRSFFLISLSSHFFHIFFFFFRQPWERLGMERERRGDITVGFSHGKRLAESPLC